MKENLFSPYALRFVPQTSSVGKAIELSPGPKDQVFDVE
jgi:hypothetical protein